MLTEEFLPETNPAAALCDYEEIPCACLSEAEISKATALAGQLGAPAPYILSRFKEYDTLVAYHQNGKLLAFQLTQQFCIGSSMFVYHGPAFSKAGAFLPMFVRYINELSQKNSNKDLYLLAEIQNPKMLMVLHGLFAGYGYSFLTKTIPGDIQQAVPVFCRNIHHIGKYNALNFTTASDYSLFKATKECESLLALMAQKNISLSKGDNMLFSAKLPAAIDERLNVLAQVQKGAASVSCWGAFKKSFLNCL